MFARPRKVARCPLVGYISATHRRTLQLTGIIAIKLLQKANIHMDIISFCYILFNFAVSLSSKTEQPWLSGSCIICVKVHLPQR